MSDLYKTLKTFGHVKTNEPLAKHTTFQIGGPARYFIEIENTEKLVELLEFLTGEGVEYYVLGGGSNLLFSDEGFDGVMIRVKNTKITTEGNKITCDAGVLLAQIVGLAAKNSLAGLEWAIGIPGTAGGAVRGNAGAMGKETANVLSEVEVWQDGEIKKLSKEECGFSYRESAFKDMNVVILSTTWELIPGDPKEIMLAMQKYIKQRTGRYPNLPSAGSFFKNIDIAKYSGDKTILPPLFIERGKIPVGWLIEQVEMKGFVVGGAKISEEHGNFVVNFDHATQEDILKIVEVASEKVYNKFGIELEPEVEIV